MKRMMIMMLALLVVSGGQDADAWVSYRFDLPSGLRESAWRDALSARLHGQKEVSIEGGRIDVLTNTQAIEVDWPHKWHEGLGQALHYADATGKQGVVALISYSRDPDHLKEKSRRRFEMVEKLCRKNGIQLVLLFPSRPYEKQQPDAVRKIASKQKQPKSKVQYWINSDTGVRHRPGCRYYGHTAHGYYCGPSEGHPCALCGG